LRRPVADSNRRGLFLYRFEPDGSLDLSFSDDDILPLRLGAVGVAISADG
jgi:hypothetical protein